MAAREEIKVQNLFGLEGKRVLVLGGGQGMGEATVRLLASLGCHVAIADRELDRAERVAGEIGQHVKTLPIEVDVLDDEALPAAIARAGRELGPLDGMATVIGMAGWSPLLDLPYDDWDADHRRNLRYFFVAAQAMARELKARGAPGSLVCVGSIDGERCAPFHASYGAAKAGLMNLVKTMAVEWSAYGIRANVVAPGATITPRIPHAGDAEVNISERIPLQRRGSVEDIASAIVFLLSDMASYITGQTLAVDGGLLSAYPIDMKPRAVTRGVIGAGGS
jgi:NAD(P)-dependent dehydrogenase (short-subunit alcohol dehydrogenase family)